jgi:hypothetical protein
MKQYIILLAIMSLLATKSFANERVNIMDKGAFPDGKTLNTQIIQTTINKVSENGGGTVYFPKGKFLTGSIMMKSHVTLELDEGAVILGSTNPLDYYFTDQSEELTNPERNDKSALALILAEDVHNIGLVGKGTIDGQGRALALHIDSLHHTGARVDPNYNYSRNRPNESARPKLFRFSKCNHVTVKNLHLRNSACWGLSFELCSNMVLDSLNIFMRAFWNNDGMDITDSRNVRVTNCYVDAADDAICLKSYFPGHWNDSIYIANCEIRSSASAVKFGTASFGGFKNVTIENIKVFDTFRSAIAIESVDGGFIENVTVNNIDAVNTGNAIFIRLGHRSGEKPGTVKNITIKNIKVQVPFGRPDWAYDMRGPALPYFHNQFPSPICGIPGHYIENVALENIEISYPGRASKGMAYVPLWRLDMVPEQIKSYPEYSMFGELPAWGFYVRHVNGISFKNITLTLDDEDFRPAYVLDDVKGLNMEKILLPENLSKQIILKDSKVGKLDPDAKKQTYVVE